MKRLARLVSAFAMGGVVSFCAHQGNEGETGDDMASESSEMGEPESYDFASDEQAPIADLGDDSMPSTAAKSDEVTASDQTLSEIARELGEGSDTAAVDEVPATTPSTVDMAEAQTDEVPDAPRDLLAVADTSDSPPSMPGFADEKDNQSDRSSGRFGLYAVKSGDTLGGIAAKLYGNRGMWKSLSGANGITNPNRIYPGQILQFEIDNHATEYAMKFESLPKSEVKVQAGDTLGKIASRLFGSASNWRALWSQNMGRIQNPNKIQVGMTLVFVSKQNMINAM